MGKGKPDPKQAGKPEKGGKEEPAKQMMNDKEAYAGIKEYMIKVGQ
jgi:hypothetical protein